MTPQGRALQTKVASVLVICALSACEGDGSAERVVRDQPVSNIADNAAAADLIPSVSTGATMSFADVQTWDNAISPIADSLFTNNPVTPWADITTGSADVFVGGVELVSNSDVSQRVFGTMYATTDFATGDITGAAQNFYSETETLHDGTLTFIANFDRTTDLATFFGISGTLTGDFTGGDIFDGPVVVDIAGDFADSATVMYGGGSGTVGGTSVDAAFVLSQD